MTSDWLDEAEEAIEVEHHQQEAIADAKTWTPDPGDLLKGTLIEAKYINTKYGWTYMVNIVDGESQAWTVWCGRTLLKNALLDQAPGLNKGIAIKYHGMKDGKEFKYHDYTMSSEPQTPDEQKASHLFYHGLATAESREEVEEITQTASEAAGLSDPF